MLKLLGLVLACASLLSLLLAAASVFFGFEPWSTAIKSEDIALFSGSTRLSGLSGASFFKGTRFCSGAGFLPRFCCRRLLLLLLELFLLAGGAVPVLSLLGGALFGSDSWLRSAICFWFCGALANVSLWTWFDFCCWFPVAVTAAALAATLEGLTNATSLSSESDVVSESESVVDAGLSRLTNDSSPGVCHFRMWIVSVGFMRERMREREKDEKGER